MTASGTGYVSGNSLPFTIVGSPSFTLNPIDGAQGATVDVLITGSNTSFPPGSTTANFGQGISVGGAAEGATGPVTVQPNGTAIAHLVINPAATLGGRTVTLFGLKYHYAVQRVRSHIRHAIAHTDRGGSCDGSR